eukprot:gene17314-biopygen6834
MTATTGLPGHVAVRGRWIRSGVVGAVSWRLRGALCRACSVLVPNKDASRLRFMMVILAVQGGALQVAVRERQRNSGVHDLCCFLGRRPPARGRRPTARGRRPTA